MQVSLDIIHHFWSDLVGRTEGPMTFRLVLQPGAALILALRDGIRDGRSGTSPYFWRIAHSDAPHRRRAWRDGFTSVTRILMVGVLMEVVYQFKVFGAFKYPGETAVVVTTLCFLPYLLARGPVARVTAWWRGRHGA